MVLQFGPRQYQWSFVLAAVHRPVLGADFLRFHHLLVDLHHERLVDAVSWAPIQAVSLTGGNPYQSILSDYPDLLGYSLNDLKEAQKTEHHLVTFGPPIWAKARRLDSAKRALARSEFDSMEAAGIVRRSGSAWSSPLHMVKKPDGSWRACGDYRRLNNCTVPDRYPVPNIKDFSSRLSGCEVFTKLDLVKGYYQVPMSLDDVPKTAVITPFGLYEFLRMPFGLKNAGSTFQRMMDKVCSGLTFVFVYLDDVLIASPDPDTHHQHLRLVLERFREHGLTINPSKCKFGLPEVDFLGHNVSAHGIRPLSDHVAAIRDFPPPRDKPQLQRFLGLLNFYRRFLPGIARVLLPLTNSLASSNLKWSWTPAMEVAFQTARESLCAATTLGHPDPSAPVSLAVDASASHVGAVLQQLVRGAWAPLAFFSRKLSGTEARYSTFDRELLAVYLALRHFRFALEGMPFTIFTDHKPLTFALHRISPPWSSRQQRHLSYIAEFTSDISYVPGPDNPVADALSRTQPTVIAALLPPPVGLDYPRMARLQRSCPDVQLLVADPKFNISEVPILGDSLLCDLSAGRTRPLVPSAMKRVAFDAIHGMAHPGMRATRRLVSERFVWRRLASECNSWTRSCLDCQRSKVQRHAKAQVQFIPVPGRRFSHVHIDIVGPLPQSRGYTHLLTIIDRSTRWPEAVPLTSTASTDCADVFFSAWISRFGVPSTITSDRGPQFVSAIWSSICSRLGITRSTTTAYHPQSNGMVERFHRQLKASLRARLASSDWIFHLPWVLLGLRVAPKDGSGLSSAEMVYGSALTVPGEFLGSPEPPPEDFIRKLQLCFDGFQFTPTPRPSPPTPVQHIPPQLLNAEFAFIRRDGHVPPLSPLYHGPYRVISTGAKFFTLQIGAKVDNISVDRLKPVLSSSPVTPSSPPRRGRPPNRVSAPSTLPAPVRRPRGRPRKTPLTSARYSTTASPSRLEDDVTTTS